MKKQFVICCSVGLKQLRFFVIFRFRLRDLNLTAYHLYSVTEVLSNCYIFLQETPLAYGWQGATFNFGFSINVTPI